MRARFRSGFIVAPIAAFGLFGACSSSNQAAELASTTAASAHEAVATAAADVGPSTTAEVAAGAVDAGTSAADATPTAATLVKAAPAPATPGPEAPPADLLALTPYFVGPDLAKLREALDQKDNDHALALLDAASSPAGPAGAADKLAPGELAARFYAAWLGAEAKPTPERVAALVALADAWPLMGDAARLRAAEAHHALGADEAALALLDKVGSGALELGPAALVRAQILNAKGQSDEARKALEAAFKATPELLPSAALALLEDLRQKGGDEAGARAMHLERAIRFPPPALADAGLDLKKLSGPSRLRWARALLDQGRLTDVKTVLEGLAGAGKPTDERCAAWILLGRAYDKAKKDADSVQTQAWKAFERALKCTGDARADATWLGGRNRLKNGEAKKALPLLKAHAKEFPKRSTADDALQMAADAEKQPKVASRARLKALERYPTGDQADNVAWSLVGPALEKRDWKKVLAAVDTILGIVPGGPPGRHPGRYPYWRGRALWELGKKDEARQAWRETVTGNPLSWYALLAYARLASEDEAAARALLGVPPVEPPAADGAPAPASPAPARKDPKVASADPKPAQNPATATDAKPADASAAAPEATQVPAALWKDAHFRRAVEWARLAGPSEAGDNPLWARVQAELDAVPEAIRGDRFVFLQMAVLELAGANPLAMRLARAEENAGRLAAPVGPEASRWRLAYPRPFAELVARWATERGLEPGWLWSIMRVESNFDPHAVSWANAYGLMQIILPTAKNLAKDTTITASPEILLQPAVAIELGTKYLARLLNRHKVYPLASAGYNAGGGAVAKWRASFGDLPLDEFVEKIPYREANLYAKATTQTLARYKWLYEGAILKLPLDAPGAASDPKGE